MKALVFAGMAAAVLSVASFAPAEARDGCGPLGHRTIHGVCMPNANAYRYYGWRRPPVYGYGWHRPYGYRPY